MKHALKSPNHRKAQSDALHFHETHGSSMHPVALKRISEMENHVLFNFLTEAEENQLKP